MMVIAPPSPYTTLQILLVVMEMDDALRKRFGREDDLWDAAPELGAEPSEPIFFGNRPGVARGGRRSEQAAVEPSAAADTVEPVHDLDAMTDELRRRVLDHANQEHGIVEKVLDTIVGDEITADLRRRVLEVAKQEQAILARVVDTLVGGISAASDSPHPANDASPSVPSAPPAYDQPA